MINEQPYKELSFLTPQQLSHVLDNTANDKHKCILLLMCDCGMRVSEVISLKVNNFDFKKRLVFVQSLKKRSEKEVRKIPISDRVYRHLSEYLYTFKNLKVDDFLFPNPTNTTHIQRFAVNRFLTRIKENNNITHSIHPHAFRHTFATNLVANKVPLENVKLMLGHKSYDTTLIYAHIPEQVLRNNIQAVTGSQRNFIQKVVDKYWTEPPKLINIRQSNNVIVGRVKELDQINQLVAKSVNLCITGGTGVGKNTLLDSLTTDKKVLVLDDTSNLKKSLVYLLVYLYENDKEAIKELLFGDFDTKQMTTKLNKESISNLCDEIIRLVDKDKYILKINELDSLTPKVTQVITRLKDHFTIITTAKNIPLNKADLMWNFEIITINNLSRMEAFELIQRLSYDMEVEDFQMYRNHIYDQTDGNPRAIFEMVTRYRKEPFILRDNIRNINHHGAMQEYDMSFIVTLFIATIAVFRYLSNELHNPSLRFIGGVAMILLIFSRQFFGRTKRKFL
jgi:integrase/recombinase XerD